MIEKILIDLNVPENKWYLYSLDENGGLVSPTPDVLFNEGFITEDDFLYQEWINKRELAPAPTETEQLKQELTAVQETLDFLIMNGGI